MNKSIACSVLFGRCTINLRAPVVVCLLAATVILGAVPTFAQNQSPEITTSLISLSPTGAIGNGPSLDVSVSADGRFIAFESKANNLVANDTNRKGDIFVRDTLEQQTTRISLASDGTQSNNKSYDPSISGDGRIIAFTSHASNLLNITRDAYVIQRAAAAYRGPGISVYAHDRETGDTALVSISSAGVPSNRHAWLPNVSPDGGFIGFSSHADNLVPPDMNRIKRDAFVRDRVSGETWYAGVLVNGENPWSGSSFPALAANGHFVAYQSLASDLVPGDTNRQFDIFVYDRELRQTTRVSIGSDGTQGQHVAKDADITPDGRFVVFSTLSVLTPGDTNLRSDIFVHDLATRETTLVSVSTSGNLGNGDSTKANISADGRFISFLSMASNFTANDKNGQQDVFVHDRLTGKTILVSQTPTGNSGRGRVSRQAMSDDGLIVAFVSTATDLVISDSNARPDVYMSVINWGNSP